MNYSHEALVDLLLANPAATNTELGAVFGRSAQWVCLVKSSGLFKERYAARRAELQDPILAANLEQNLTILANRSIEILNEKLSGPAALVSDDLALEAAKLGAKAMGVGGFSNKPPPAPPGEAATLRLDRIADRLLNLHRAASPAQDISYVEVVQAAS